MAFAFADSSNADPGDTDVRVACAWLAGPRAPEAWQLGNAYRTLALEQFESDGDIAGAAQRIYADLIAEVRGSSHPYLLRIWNYLGAINAGDGDGERYRRFCVGRAAAVDAAFNDPPPAATAIGNDGDAGTLQVIALCSRTPAIALENPRQTPAWNYPRDYGPVAPGFSRGALLGADGASPRLLASGTASIVGHVSQHIGDVAEQLRESLRNLEALLAVGNERSGRVFALLGCEALRVYLRHAKDLSVAQTVIDASGLPCERVLYLRGDVCRRELDVELEGVFAAD
ncbi:MAG TPA: pteridine-dependent deoxygenase [Xanthomonadaceae bacterium]|nr:pteridine-dependent deoxygenase [Xanthomonadaceae bacterium]